MFIPAFLLAAATVPSASSSARPCRAAQLRLSLDGRDGNFNGMSHSGTELSIRNTGADCMIAALPTIQFLDGHGRTLPVTRTAPVGMHPGPVMMPVRIAGGHRVVTDLRWVSGPVFPQNRKVSLAAISVSVEGHRLRVPLTATLYGAAGKPVGFDQPPLRAVEGMAAG